MHMPQTPQLPRLKTWLPLLLLLLVGCATRAPGPELAPPVQLLQDALYAPAENVPSAEAVFALSPAMLDYAQTQLASAHRQSDPRMALLDALYKRNGLQLSYDASRTRNAAEAFEAREGNCLSLVLMTASFARHLSLPVSYQVVLTDEYFSRSGNLVMNSQHVNLVLGPTPPRVNTVRSAEDTLTVDFLPASELRGQRTRSLPERTLVAMYFNNRAAEWLALGQTNKAYWWARQALLHDPGYSNAANTLGVIYLRAGQLQAAEAALRHVLDNGVERLNALANLVPLLQRQQRHAEADSLAQELARLQPVPPFQRLQEGQQAMNAGRYEQALALFQQELRLQPYQDEVHFWAAQAAWRLGRFSEAARHMARASEYSTTRDKQERYSAKLEQLRHGPRVQ
jgi:tetratricopeptide (TPR) repeat protein